MGSIGTTARLVNPPAQPEPSVASARRSHRVTFNLEDVEPPSVLYVTIDDQLQVTLAGLSTAAVTLEVRILLANGSITVQEEQITAPNSRTPANRAFRLPEGYILSATLAAMTPGIPRGTLFGMLSLVRSQSPAPTYTYALASGYLGLLSPVWWPGPRIEQPGTGGGVLNTVSVPNPAAGTDWSYTPPAGVRQRVQSIQATLTTSAAVANRTVVIHITQGGNVLYSAADPTPQTASTTVTYTFAPGLPAQGATGNVVVTPLPAGLVINSTFTISVSTIGLQAGDQWSAINISTEDSLDV
jgi:hypothetical protein